MIIQDFRVQRETFPNFYIFDIKGSFTLFVVCLVCTCTPLYIKKHAFTLYSTIPALFDTYDACLSFRIRHDQVVKYDACIIQS